MAAGMGDTGARSVVETPPSMLSVPRSPATPSTPGVSLHAADSSADTTLSTVGCVYFADTFLLTGRLIVMLNLKVILICIAPVHETSLRCSGLACIVKKGISLL